MAFVWFVLIGIAAGWLAQQIMKGGGSGLVVDRILGVVGALVGRLVVATMGAVLPLYLLRIVRPAAGG